MRIQGVYPPIATPFDERGHLNCKALAANIQRWDETGLNGYVIAGSNGENVLLDADEITTAVRGVRRAAAPGKLVIAGTGCQSTAATIRLTCAVADVGADAALVMTPSFYSVEMTDAALLHHYEAVADASPLPILIYNVPKFTHLNISAAVVARLAEHDKIIGVKDSAGDVNQLVEFIRLCPPDFDVLIGNAGAYLDGLKAGAAGGILAVANVAPYECVAIWRLVRDNRYDEARETHVRVMPTARAVTSQYGVPGLKAAMDLIGYYGGAPRLPLLPLELAAREDIRNILTEAGLMA